MTRFLLGRCLGLVLTLLAASAVVFLVLDVLPGDVAQVMLGPDADPQAVQALAAQLGLDRPAWVRYGQWLLGLLRGELGMSQAYGVPVAGLLAERLVLTVPLTLLAMGLAGGMALLAGVYAALHHRRWGDVGLMALAQLGMATPGFWLGMLLIVVFSVQLGAVGRLRGLGSRAVAGAALPVVAGTGAGLCAGGHSGALRAHVDAGGAG